MSLITDFGRYNRAEVIARAKELHAFMEWGAALAAAYREASEELRQRFNRQTTVPQHKVKETA